MMGKLSVVVVALMLMSFCAFSESVPPITGKAGATLKNLEGSSTLVTIVLRDKGATSANLRVLGSGPDHVSILDSNNERTAYRLSDIAEIRVQAERVEVKKVEHDETRSLGAEEQRVLGRAFERAQEIYAGASANQNLKIRAATLAALNGDKAAREYLEQLASSNDLGTSLDALLSLYLAGEHPSVSEQIQNGLASGSRAIRAKAAILAGLYEEKSLIPNLITMLEDRNAELSAPAAKALGWLRETSMITPLLDMAVEVNEEKADAAVYALSQIGGEQVITPAKARLRSSRDIARYRVSQLLYAMDDPTGKEVFRKEIMTTPTMTPSAALLLAADKDYDAMQYLRGRLKERYNETEDNLSYRAMASVALLRGDDTAAVTGLQALLR